jgi:hypothetical protein
MSNAEIDSILIVVPALWLFLLLLALAGRARHPDARGWTAMVGALVGIVGIGLLGGCVGLAFGWYATRGADDPLPGIAGLLGLAIGVVPGALIGALIAVRDR